MLAADRKKSHKFCKKTQNFRHFLRQLKQALCLQEIHVMKLSLYQIDAFANKPFEGNPAAICPLDEWLSDDLMQSIATENNLSETAFFVKTNKGYSIRWFTPAHEVDLCGHATLASAYVIFNILKHGGDEILFESKSGLLEVKQNKDWLEMNFPSQPAIKCSVPKLLLEAFDEEPIECLQSEDYILVFKNEESILNANPKMSLLSELDLRGVAITSISENYDFISRFFLIRKNRQPKYIPIKISPTNCQPKPLKGFLYYESREILFSSLR